MRFTLGLGVAALVIGAGLPLWAHHSHGNYEDTFMDIEGVVKEVHLAGGVTVEKSYLQRPVLADSHSHPVPDGALDLLDHTLARQSPDAIVLERDDRLDAVDEIMDDVRRIRARLARRHLGKPVHGSAAAGSAN